MASQTQIIGNWTVYSAAKLGQQKIYKRAVIKTPHCYLTLCEWNPPVTSGSKTSPCYWPFGRGIHQWPLDSPHKGQWKCPLMQKMMCKPCFRILRDKLWLFVPALHGSINYSPFAKWSMRPLLFLRFKVMKTWKMLDIVHHSERRICFGFTNNHISCVTWWLNICSGCPLTHGGWDKMVAIFHTTFWNGFSRTKMYEVRLRFHWSLFPRVQLTIFQYWFW